MQGVDRNGSRSRLGGRDYLPPERSMGRTGMPYLASGRIAAQAAAPGSSRASRPLSNASGRGGQPRMCRSTGTTAETPPTHRVAAGEDAAVERAVADRDHPFRIGRRVVGALQRLAHVLGHRPGHHQHVGMARRGDEAQAEALEVVERVVERVDLQLAAVAGAGVDLADRQAAAEPAARRAVDAWRQARPARPRPCAGGGSVSGRRDRLSNRILRMRRS